MPTPPLKIQFSVLKSTYAHWVTDCEYCPWTKPQPSRPAGSYANGEEQWSAFTVGLIYELDLLRLFIEWVTAYATSSCVNSCVQGEGKKKKKNGKGPKLWHPFACANSVFENTVWNWFHLLFCTQKKRGQNGNCSGEGNPLPGHPQHSLALLSSTWQLSHGRCSRFLPYTPCSPLPPREQGHSVRSWSGVHKNSLRLQQN